MSLDEMKTFLQLDADRKNKSDAKGQSQIADVGANSA